MKIQSARLHIISTICIALLFSGYAFASTPIEEACKQPLDAKVGNSCVVIDQMLWRGARPDAEAAATLVDLGVKTVVSLELILNDRKAFETAKPKSAGTREIQYFQIRDWEPLVMLAPGKEDDHIAHFLALARTQPKPIYVHCRSGQNRTGIMVAAYRIFAGADIEETIREMEKYGGIWSKADATYLRSLTPKHREAMEKMIAVWLPKLQRTALIKCDAGKCKFSKAEK